jgi:2-polyprenyl-3-methyl-5-hydroxy-6-metoxy-1,4-benzoquinol methylase
MAYEELKSRQSVMWGTGPYQRVTETISDIHELVVERLDPQPGVRWLDLACGTGAVAERAAAADFARAWIDFFESEYRSGDEIVHTREYLFVWGRRR